MLIDELLKGLPMLGETSPFLTISKNGGNPLFLAIDYIDFYIYGMIFA